MNLALQFIGALVILVAFALMLAGQMGRQDFTYLWLNLAGSVLLAIDAWQERQWGFVLLQIVWGTVAAWGLLKGAGSGPPARPSTARTDRLIPPTGDPADPKRA